MSNKEIKINDSCYIELNYKTKWSNDTVLLIKVKDTQLGMKYETLEAIYKEYKKHIFNNEIKEIIDDTN